MSEVSTVKVLLCRCLVQDMWPRRNPQRSSRPSEMRCGRWKVPLNVQWLNRSPRSTHHCSLRRGRH